MISSSDSIACSICLESIHGFPASLNKCCHKFCFDCIYSWSNVNPTCPICKASFNRIICQNKSVSIKKNKCKSASTASSTSTDYYEDLRNELLSVVMGSINHSASNHKRRRNDSVFISPNEDCPQWTHSSRSNRRTNTESSSHSETFNTVNNVSSSSSKSSKRLRRNNTRQEMSSGSINNEQQSSLRTSKMNSSALQEEEEFDC